jgi:hypothetical protein
MTAAMQLPATHPGADGLVHPMPERRLCSTLLTCAIAPALMLTVVYRTVGPGLIRARVAVSTA